MAFKERTTTQDYLKSTYFGGWPNLFWRITEKDKKNMI